MVRNEFQNKIFNNNYRDLHTTMFLFLKRLVEGVLIQIAAKQSMKFYR